MNTFLQTILDHKREEVRALSRDRSRSSGKRTSAHRRFARALDLRPSLALIGEVKKASPSKGLIRENFDPAAIATAYETGGVQAVSVLTDERFFQGSLGYLTQVREAIALPVLRKDFIIDPRQVEQSAGVNADALLLIVAALSDGQLAELFSACVELDIEPLVEIHSLRELERAQRLSPPLLGINNRNLETFEVDLNTALSIVPEVPAHTVVVSESGITTGKDTESLIKAGVHAVLVGESLMRCDDISALIRELRHQ